MAPRPSSHISNNVVHFARALRATGMPIGPDRIANALRVLTLTGIQNRSDMHDALSCTLLDRHENQAMFDIAFDAFWQDPKLLDAALNEALQAGAQNPPAAAASKTPARLAQALGNTRAQPTPPDDDADKTDAAASFSQDERLRQLDFDSMTQAEFDAASALVRQLELPLRPVLTRRFKPAVSGQPDLRRTMHRMLREPGTLRVASRSRTLRQPSLVVLLDVSGSMERYARIFLHFIHGLTQRYQKVDTLVFGTRLTNISRCLRDRDVDIALASASHLVHDWRGGTRIATSLATFNKQWARRLLAGNASLILVTDGLDRDESGNLSREAARLAGFAREIIWLNPLLRYDGFEPKAAGIRALLPVADHFLPMHNISSLADLGKRLQNTADGPNQSRNPI